MRGAKGLITLDDGVIKTEVVVVHCCHCGLILGSAEAILQERVRGEGNYGWCSRCRAMHHAGCRTCTPQEQGCDNVEAGRAWADNGSATKLFLPVAFPGK